MECAGRAKRRQRFGLAIPNPKRRRATLAAAFQSAWRGACAELRSFAGVHDRLLHEYHATVSWVSLRRSDASFPSFYSVNSFPGLTRPRIPTEGNKGNEAISGFRVPSSRFRVASSLAPIGGESRGEGGVEQLASALAR